MEEYIKNVGSPDGDASLSSPERPSTDTGDQSLSPIAARPMYLEHLMRQPLVVKLQRPRRISDAEWTTIRLIFTRLSKIMPLEEVRKHFRKRYECNANRPKSLRYMYAWILSSRGVAEAVKTAEAVEAAKAAQADEALIKYLRFFTRSFTKAMSALEVSLSGNVSTLSELSTTDNEIEVCEDILLDLFNGDNNHWDLLGAPYHLESTTPDAKKRKLSTFFEDLEHEHEHESGQPQIPHSTDEQGLDQVSHLVDLLNAYPVVARMLQLDRTSLGQARSSMTNSTRMILDQALDRLKAWPPINSTLTDNYSITPKPSHGDFETGIQSRILGRGTTPTQDLTIPSFDFLLASPPSDGICLVPAYEPLLDSAFPSVHAASDSPSPTVSRSASIETHVQPRASRPPLAEITCVLCGVAELPDAVSSAESDYEVAKNAVSGLPSVELMGAPDQSRSAALKGLAYSGGKATGGEMNDGDGNDGGSGERGEQSPGKPNGNGAGSGFDGTSGLENWYNHIDLACTEFVANPTQNRDCSVVVLKSISAVVQHLKRNHNTHICGKCCQLTSDHALQCHRNGSAKCSKWRQIFEKTNRGRGIPYSPYLRDHLDLITAIYTTDLLKFLGPGFAYMIGDRIAQHLDQDTSLIPRAQLTTIRALKLALFGESGCFTEYYETTNEEIFASLQSFLNWMRQQQVALISPPDSGYGGSPDFATRNQIVQANINGTPFSYSPYPTSTNNSSP
ncbi:hypothetical protein H2198_010412 [Neophaeococcomyces mojaviensis]|uniref:Uncharacterized protein n=1 Tax=Neophaeococcomyces mojaviensis TaxID=3383035 RepID=A0ACC2ZRP9_9EURO|nr:hypothetical protein H2198_010412 [Knufia sp. JES_112]